mmetsp:Transcript_28846/g.65166  ORF Transcript_28846/g.65166 Transcript_28846/m.65166 type:complete len:389 (+) Transcript_28846:53-1219(+)
MLTQRIYFAVLVIACAEGVRTHARHDVEGQAQCDLSKGRWERTETQEPYSHLSVEPAFRCPHKTAFKYSWVPDNCELPAFQAEHMRSIANRQGIVMIGDSLVRNMYESLHMLLRVPTHITFTSQNYFGCLTRPMASSTLVANTTNDYEYKSSILRKAVEELAGAGRAVEQFGDAGQNLISEGAGGSFDVGLDRANLGFLKPIRNNTIVLIGGGHHFAHRGNRYSWQGMALNDTGGNINVEAYRLALTNVVRKLEDMRFTGHVILQTYSPAHYFVGDWDTSPPGYCDGHTEPRNDIKEYTDLGSTTFSSIEDTNLMLHSLVTESTLKIKILDITGMSWGRADAHPGQDSRNDCSHWCLPGLPDVWNQAFLSLLSGLELDQSRIEKELSM